MSIFSQMAARVEACVSALAERGQVPKGMDLARVAVEPPREAAHGDMATNAAMVLAKQAGTSPRDLAREIAALLEKEPSVKSAEIAGPGFINLRLENAAWTAIVPEAIAAGADFGRPQGQRRRKVNVEFVSANPTGPLHIGHARGAVFGDALASLLEFAGHEVTREYYTNDAGSQVDVLARSVYARYLQAHGKDAAVEADGYPGEYLIPVGERLREKAGDKYVDKPEEDWLEPVKAFAMEEMMDLIRGDLESLGVNMSVFFSEKSLYESGRIESAIEELGRQGLIYEGVLEPPKGKLVEGWEPRVQTLFKSTEHGDDVDRAVRKSDGSWTYFAPDIAYHHDKIQRGFDELINVFGADHGGYVKRIKAVVSALSGQKVPLDIKIAQTVRVLIDGKPAKMGKRTGNFILLRDVVEKVGRDIARFVMLTRKNDAPLDFDFQKALEQSRDNPVFYVQYANARINSVLSKAAEAGIDTGDKSLMEADLSPLAHESELALVRKVAEWPRLVELAATHHEPHRIAFYLHELASELHSLWNRGSEDASLKFIQENDKKASQAKIALLRGVEVVISAGFGILGVTPVKEMR